MTARYFGPPEYPGADTDPAYLHPIGSHKPWPKLGTLGVRHALCEVCERPISLRERPLRYSSLTWWVHDRTPKWATEGRATP